MGFSITSAVLGGVIIICYSLSIAQCRDRKERYDRYYRNYSPSDIKSKLKNYEPEMAISAMILILGIVEFVIGIWAPVCCCLMSSCACCVPRQQVRLPEKTTSKRTILIIPQAENRLVPRRQRKAKPYLKMTSKYFKFLRDSFNLFNLSNIADANNPAADSVRTALQFR